MRSTDKRTLLTSGPDQTLKSVNLQITLLPSNSLCISVLRTTGINKKPSETKLK